MQTSTAYEFNDLAVNYYGKEICKPGHSYSVNFENKYLMHYIADGEGVFRVNGKEYKLKKGNAFIISKDRGCYEASKKNPWTYFWVNFSGEVARKFFNITGITPSNPIYQTNEPDAVTRCFEDFLAAGVKNKFLTFGKFFELLGIMYEKSETKNDFDTRATASEYVNKCEGFIKANYYRRITMNELSEYVGLEYSYLFRLFKEKLGISPGNYIINYKLSKAASFLQNTNMNVSEASLAVGYTDRVAFTRLFARKYGLSPQRYKMSIK